MFDLYSVLGFGGRGGMERHKGYTQNGVLELSRAHIPLASFPGPIKERRGPGTHCSRMRGLHDNQVAGVIDEAQTKLVYL